ncbi:hypothetical protein P5W11_09370 [Mycobacteroides abscessus subsp. bolletii]|uniref:hypothetical protein n=1 Tax=Mycobacteroides abscessus TaxID=36809 RepID=UPI00266C9256|nr:hypothetical protein [Mycobacteroides abscessus]MDO3068419.1 hypothetical protein [Mycobacteroides abscessus subsp. bolletii]
MVRERKLSEEQVAHLELIARRRARRDSAESLLIEAIKDGQNLGLTQPEIGKAAGLTKQRVGQIWHGTR